MAFDNENRSRYYGKRIGDTVNAKGLNGRSILNPTEVVGYGSDNNRILVKDEKGEPVDWVAEWCDVLVKVEDKCEDCSHPLIGFVCPNCDEKL